MVNHEKVVVVKIQFVLSNLIHKVEWKDTKATWWHPDSVDLKCHPEYAADHMHVEDKEVEYEEDV